MKMQPMAVTETFLFRLAHAVLPEAAVLALFGRRIPLRVESSRAARPRRMGEGRRRD